MVDLTVFGNQLFQILEYIESQEVYEDNQLCSKCSLDSLGERFSISKHTAKNYMDDLCQNNYIEKINVKGKYNITKKGREVLAEMHKGRDSIKASKYKCCSLFAGVGGIDLGFHNAGFETVYANEFDPKAAHTFEKNFDIKVDTRDIHEVVNELENGDDPFNGKTFNILLGGFPCQAFSIAGYREGFEDKKGRGGLFFEIMKIARITKPEVIFLENVKNLVSHDKGKTFRIISEALESEGYYIHHQVLNSMEYGNVPQNRERIYVVAFKDKEKYEKFKFPYPVELSNDLSKVIDFNSKEADRFYYTENNFSHYDEIKDIITRQDTVYQWRRVYVRENKSGVCPTLTANMGTGGHNVPLVYTKYGIRKLTPRECFSIQGFPKTYVLPDDIALSYLYKQAGNSVTVSVIERIAKEILKVL